MMAILGMALFAPSSLGVPYSIMDTYTRPPPSQKLTPLREFTMLRLRKVCCSLDPAFGNYQIVDECARSPVIHINEDPVKRVNVLHTIRIRLCV
jgi:hypothetical protein